MLKFITEKLLGQILPSVVATVIAAYVVNQYIVARPDAPPAAAQQDAAKAAKPAEPVAATMAPEPARSEPVKSEPLKVKLGTDKEKPAKSEPARDPNQVLRAAVERLRASAPAEAPRLKEVSGRAPEPLKSPEPPLRAQELPRLQETTRVAAPALPPAVNVALGNSSIVPNANVSATAASVPVSIRPADAADLSDGDQRRPTPPADIPAARAESSGEGAAARKPSVAEDVLFTAKSVIHSVLPR
ncbi:hypothetical protein FLL57_16110 [Rhodopseudomonas palustris]|uniref:hypothetical protein n=1 Tax=Rhodopseudomonas palustris TaxID=1076 RepID=UPI00115D24A2|nr:hypothetical protein [Rhodopseudomonas palustris]QDL98736.1 hypothetical protein FLL57_16110 [Rhodopseudomonas palustris]